MNNKILALKYRPQVFQDLIGQEVMAQTITNAINLKKTEFFDVSSGVENSEGIKDEKLISEFISKANKAIK